MQVFNKIRAIFFMANFDGKIVKAKNCVRKKRRIIFIFLTCRSSVYKVLI